MPTSHYRQLNELVEAIVTIRPTSILDIGVGFGKFGFLAHEYLDASEGRLRPSDWTCRIDGIEGHQQYISPLHEQVYDRIFIADAKDIIPNMGQHYDLALMIDVVEHFEREDAYTMLSHLINIASNILISTPKFFMPQDASFGNILEVHRSLWSARDFAEYVPHCFIPNETSLICVIGKDVQKVKGEMLSFRRKIKRNFPYVTDMYRTLRLMRMPKR